MEKYRLLITEVTNFGELRCVAGLDLDRNIMIRPEPHPQGFWPSNAVAPVGNFDVGETVEFDGKAPAPPTDLPHLTEDRVVVGRVVKGPALDGEASKKLLRNSARRSLKEIFDGNLVVDGQKGYVPVGAKCGSLGGLIVPAKGVRIESYHNLDGKQRLRLRFRDGDNYLAPNLTSSKAYAEYAEGKLDEMNGRLTKASSLLLRIGLARGFPAFPDRCYLQVNGLSTL